MTGLDPVDEDKLTRTVTGVEKHLSGELSVTARGREYYCSLDLSVSVECRIIEWTYDALGAPHLVDPQVKERVVRISGVAAIDGVD